MSSNDVRDDSQPTRKRRGKAIEKDVKQLLRDKLRAKQHARLSRDARYNLMDELEKKIKSGKDVVRCRKELSELEDIDEREQDNEAFRTIPNYD
jgi:hypothetical protein